MNHECFFKRHMMLDLRGGAVFSWFVDGGETGRFELRENSSLIADDGV